MPLGIKEAGRRAARRPALLLGGYQTFGQVLRGACRFARQASLSVIRGGLISSCYFFFPPPVEALVPDDMPAGTFGAFSFFGFLTSLLLRACPLAMSVSCCWG